VTDAFRVLAEVVDPPPSAVPAPPAGAPFAYGAPGWIPVVGDWEGDGRTTLGVVDPTTASWYLRDSNSPGAADLGVFTLGQPGWRPIGAGKGRA
jgi:hypothetical protein